MTEEPLSEDPGDEGDDRVVTPEGVTPVEESDLEDVPEKK